MTERDIPKSRELDHGISKRLKGIIACPCLIPSIPSPLFSPITQGKRHISDKGRIKHIRHTFDIVVHVLGYGIGRRIPTLRDRFPKVDHVLITVGPYAKSRHMLKHITAPAKGFDVILICSSLG
jgi:hypothetical protein